MGNSQNVTKVLVRDQVRTRRAQTQFLRNSLIEEFIEGYEVTVPVLFDAALADYVVLPPVLYLPNVPDPTKWFLSYKVKMDPNNRPERRISTLSRGLIRTLRASSRALNFQTLARFDFRWQTNNVNTDEIRLQDLWFLEINCLPTLRTDVNFLRSVKHYIGNRTDPLSKHVRQARTPDIAALAYLLLQSHMEAFKTK